MNYEEKYNDLLSRIKRMADVQPDVTRMAIESLFPELKESEDKRIRKALKQYFVNSFQNNGVAAICGVHIKDVLAWLEKQKGTEREIEGNSFCNDEQKPVISYDALREGIAHFGITQYQIDNWLKKYVDVEKQGEQQ